MSSRALLRHEKFRDEDEEDYDLRDDESLRKLDVKLGRVARGDTPLARAMIMAAAGLLLGLFVLVLLWGHQSRKNTCAKVEGMGPSSSHRHKTWATSQPIEEPPSSQPTWEPNPFWGAEVDEDRGVQSFLLSFYNRRMKKHRAALEDAQLHKKKRNDRTAGKAPPILVYWESPPLFWSQYYGEGKGEQIYLDPYHCPVSCQLVSGFPNDPNGHKFHVKLEYGKYEGAMPDHRGDFNTGLLPYQKIGLYTMEATSFAPEYRLGLGVFDFMATISKKSEIFYESYTGRYTVPGHGGALLGVADINSPVDADAIWGVNRDQRPGAKIIEKLNIPPELRAGPFRIPTFISNCYAPTRNRLIRELIKEGIHFDHYGGCNETFFGGSPPPYSLSYAKEVDRETGGGVLSKFAILSLYPINLVLENTIQTDYITEKPIEAFLAGGVPIVLGAPNLAEQVQPPGTDPLFINALDYSPKELADLMKKLSVDKEAAAKYSSWTKTVPSRTPLMEYSKRVSDNDLSKRGQFMPNPICGMCKIYHNYYDWQGDSPATFQW